MVCIGLRLPVQLLRDPTCSTDRGQVVAWGLYGPHATPCRVRVQIIGCMQRKMSASWRFLHSHLQRLLRC